MNSVSERDWKVFRNLHGTLVERYCEKALSEIAQIAATRDQGACDRFSAVDKLIRERRKHLSELSTHSRSSAFFIIARMNNREKLFLPGEFEKFSAEIRAQVLALTPPN